MNIERKLQVRVKENIGLASLSEMEGKVFEVVKVYNFQFASGPVLYYQFKDSESVSDTEVKAEYCESLILDPMRTIDGVDVYNICDFDPQFDLKYGEFSEVVLGWCKENNSYYYAKPKEDFFIYEAVREAKEKGQTKVVVEDIS